MQNSPDDSSMYHPGAGEPSPRARKSSAGAWIMLLTILVVLIVLGFVFRDKLFGTSVGNNMTTSSFQAVFLTNGQVYFGKFANVNDRYATMENIYYLQVTPVLQTKTEGEVGSQPSAQQQQRLEIVKLGNELHGPVDKMFINRDQILFFEDLKDDGKVVQAIRKFESEKK